MTDEDLSLRREQNIERNNRYLEQLGLLPASKIAEKVVKPNRTITTLDDESKLVQKTTKTLFREKETDFIINYYNSVRAIQSRIKF